MKQEGKLRSSSCEIILRGALRLVTPDQLSKTNFAHSSGDSIRREMPWSAAKSFGLDRSVPHSIFPNNLAGDGDGSIAFAQGNQVRYAKGLSHSAKSAAFTLGYSEKLNVTSVFWWSGLEDFKRPLLVFTTESSNALPANVQVWNLWKKAGSRIYKSHLDVLESGGHLHKKAGSTGYKTVQFCRGLAQASTSPVGQLLFCGSSNGSIFGLSYVRKENISFKQVCTLHDYQYPVVALAGDRLESNYLASSDENGRLVVWRVEEELDRDRANVEMYRSQIVYEHHVQDGFVCALGLMNNFVVAGHSTGYVTFHDVDTRFLMASVVTNTRAIMGIDIYPHKNIVLVCGEDCRVSVVRFSESYSYKPVVHFSVALEAIITGCAFTNRNLSLPKFAVLTWEKIDIIEYEYGKAKK